jgi:GMP synthase PP-ATPase subunit
MWLIQRACSSSASRITDPEDKRKIIGRTFIDVFEQEANTPGGAIFWPRHAHLTS